MFWWFQRDGKFLRYETRATHSGAFELRVIAPDGSEQVETFTDSSALTKRQIREPFLRDAAHAARESGQSTDALWASPATHERIRAYLARTIGRK